VFMKYIDEVTDLHHRTAWLMTFREGSLIRIFAVNSPGVPRDLL
jgi:hypothetical protein